MEILGTQVVLESELNALGQPVGLSVGDWTPPPKPSRAPMLGRYCRLEALDPARHAEALHRQRARCRGAPGRIRPMAPSPILPPTGPGWSRRRRAKIRCSTPSSIWSMKPGRGGELPAHRARGGFDRGRPPAAAPAAPPGGDRGDVPDDAARFRAWLSSLRVEMQRAQRAVARCGAAPGLPPSRASSGRRS